MSFGERISECSRSRTVRIVLALLLLLLIIVGVVWLYSSNDDETHSDSLSVVPSIGGSNSLIHYKVSDLLSVRNVTSKIENALEPYNATSPNVYTGCNFYNNAPNGKTCSVNLTSFDPCTRKNWYGYTEGKPCVFLKLTRHADWVPQFYNETQLPSGIPEEVRTDIQNLVRPSKKLAQMIWVTCDGQHEADRENIGPIRQSPRGFPGFYYPCTSEESCTDPLVSIQFQKPTRGVAINVECKIWAGNLRESIVFQLLVE